MTGPAPLMTEADVSAWLGIATETLRKMRRQGRIPFLKVGKAVRYDREQLQVWLTGSQPPAVLDPEPAARHAGGRPRGGQRARLAELHAEGLRRASAQ